MASYVLLSAATFKDSSGGRSGLTCPFSLTSTCTARAAIERILSRTRWRLYSAGLFGERHCGLLGRITTSTNCTTTQAHEKTRLTSPAQSVNSPREPRLRYGRTSARFSEQMSDQPQNSDSAHSQPVTATQEHPLCPVHGKTDITWDEATQSWMFCCLQYTEIVGVKLF